MSSSTGVRIAFVCQRYGLDINGGAELYCRLVAEKLAAFYQVTVYTTCANDYMTWKNDYAPGIETINGVTVKRYPVQQERNPADFNALSRIIYSDKDHTAAQEEAWIDAQGPLCPDLLSALKTEHANYRIIFFVTYLYYPSARGLRLQLPNAAMIPTLHDEPPVWLKAYDSVFSNTKAVVWNTAGEREFGYTRFPFLKKIPDALIGLGIEMPDQYEYSLPEELKDQHYLVYAGRIDASKGCEEMFRYFRNYLADFDSDLKLVLMGKSVLDIPDDPSIIQLGFVPENVKLSVMANSLALVLFSKFESLSMVVLESMMMGRPVIVNSHCPVLKEHCVRSNAGLYFRNYSEFALILEYLRFHPEEYRIMCENGQKYVHENYRWEVVLQKYRDLIDHFQGA